MQAWCVLLLIVVAMAVPTLAAPLSTQAPTPAPTHAPTLRPTPMPTYASGYTVSGLIRFGPIVHGELDPAKVYPQIQAYTNLVDKLVADTLRTLIGVPVYVSVYNMTVSANTTITPSMLSMLFQAQAQNHDQATSFSEILTEHSTSTQSWKQIKTIMIDLGINNYGLFSGGALSASDKVTLLEAVETVPVEFSSGPTITSNTQASSSDDEAASTTTTSDDDKGIGDVTGVMWLGAGLCLLLMLAAGYVVGSILSRKQSPHSVEEVSVLKGGDSASVPEEDEVVALDVPPPHHKSAGEEPQCNQPSILMGTTINPIHDFHSDSDSSSDMDNSADEASAASAKTMSCGPAYFEDDSGLYI
eukprot:TRINITY_DN27672_c0_g1_i1.p1 TRINITY_DN27672_c0_g1~~TRINITY_DN27672_c0_g1_i1.p1  ORF type:complete len:358 (+),score=66.59 TRINITY_DN27672_c0_g1_i1:141-1214(+)